MAGVSAVGGLSTTAFEAQYQTRVAKIGIDALKEQGQQALQLIQAASIDTQSGQNLNVSI